MTILNTDESAEIEIVNGGLVLVGFAERDGLRQIPPKRLHNPLELL